MWGHYNILYTFSSLQWHHNESDGVSNHWCLDCLLNRLCRRRSKKTSAKSSASLAFVREIHRLPVNSPHKRPVTRTMFPFDDVIICNTFSVCQRSNITQQSSSWVPHLILTGLCHHQATMTIQSHAGLFHGQSLIRCEEMFTKPIVHRWSTKCSLHVYYVVARTIVHSGSKAEPG